MRRRPVSGSRRVCLPFFSLFRPANHIAVRVVGAANYLPSDIIPKRDRQSDRGERFTTTGESLRGETLDRSAIIDRN
jgi:hypothetical protein